MRTFQDPAVLLAFESFAEPHRTLLLEVRELAFEIAEANAGVGPLSETLKWGQPSYRPEAAHTGTAVRLGQFGEHRSALFVHCQTTLVDAYRKRFPELSYAGNRAIVLNPEEPLRSAALRVCIELALTYKLRGRGRARA